MLKVLFRFMVGPLVAVISLVGIVHGARASLAQGLYYQASYGEAKDNPDRVLEACARAERLYVWNYLFCSRATGSAFVKADSLTNAAQKARFLAAAEKWCDCGLSLNPYSRELILRKAGLLGSGNGGAAKAAAYWAGYTDWHYWNPENHSILGRMYVWAGDFEKAEACASLIRNTREFAVLRRAIDEEKARQSAFRRE